MLTTACLAVPGGTLQQRRREQSTGEIPALSGLAPPYVNIGISRREEEGRGDVGNPYTGVIVRVLTFFFFFLLLLLPTKTDE